MKTNPPLSGMSYEQASREGERLLKQALETGNWHRIVDDLVQLRELMKTLGANPA